MSAVMIAHRGARAVAPENTLCNLQRCIDLGYGWAEVDVRRTADGHHVLLHDETLDRTTRGRGPVRAASLAHIRSLDAGAWFDDRFAGTPVPTLREALDLARGKLGLYLDCRDVDVARLAAEVRDAGMTGNVMVLGPREVYPVLRETAGDRVRLVAYCEGAATDIAGLVRDTGASIVEVLIERTTPALAGAVHEAGVALECVALGASDCRDEWQRCRDLGAEWIMTDRPGELRRMLEDEA